KFFRGPIVDLCAAILCSLVDSIFYHEPERIGYLAVCDDYDVRLLLGKACNRKQQAPENGESRNEFCLHFRWLLFFGGRYGFRPLPQLAHGPAASIPCSQPGTECHAL